MQGCSFHYYCNKKVRNNVSREVNKYIVIVCDYNAALERNHRDVERCVRHMA